MTEWILSSSNESIAQASEGTEVTSLKKPVGVRVDLVDHSTYHVMVFSCPAVKIGFSPRLGTKTVQSVV